MKELSPGMTVRVEHNARIIGLAEKGNQYWYEVEYPDGRRDTVNISRLHWYADEVRATFDADGSVHVISNKLTPQGAIDLFHWLRTHYGDFEAALANTSCGDTVSINPPESGTTK